MTDLLNLFTEMRNGAVIADLNQKFHQVLSAVLETAGKGELTIKLSIKPSKLGMGGAVLEVEAEHTVKLKRPELEIGKSLFFVNRNGDLTRDDPAQTAMFEQQAEEKKSNGRTQ